jgi:hypothetical protein
VAVHPDAAEQRAGACHHDRHRQLHAAIARRSELVAITLIW